MSKTIEEYLPELMKDETPSASEAMQGFEEKEFLREAISSLDENERLFLTLRYYEGLSIKEISRILGISVHGIYRLKIIVLEKLKKELKG
jgi:RNA polymerase sigma factor for flagellar operon FliA